MLCYAAMGMGHALVEFPVSCGQVLQRSCLILKLSYVFKSRKTLQTANTAYLRMAQKAITHHKKPGKWNTKTTHPPCDSLIFETFLLSQTPPFSPNGPTGRSRASNQGIRNISRALSRRRGSITKTP